MKVLQDLEENFQDISAGHSVRDKHPFGNGSVFLSREVPLQLEIAAAASDDSYSVSSSEKAACNTVALLKEFEDYVCTSECNNNCRKL